MEIPRPFGPPPIAKDEKKDEFEAPIAMPIITQSEDMQIESKIEESKDK